MSSLCKPSLPSRYLLFAEGTDRQKTPIEFDTTKVEAARQVLGTEGLTDDDGAAPEQVSRRVGREKVIRLLSDPSTSDLDDPEVMAGAWR